MSLFFNKENPSPQIANSVALFNFRVPTTTVLISNKICPLSDGDFSVFYKFSIKPSFQISVKFFGKKVPMMRSRMRPSISPDIQMISNSTSKVLANSICSFIQSRNTFNSMSITTATLYLCTCARAHYERNPLLRITIYCILNRFTMFGLQFSLSNCISMDFWNAIMERSSASL